ncbi:DegT/DnrJ/EryC1/StrS family aminotransferase [Candidatus Microgenomates bacterium]|nr:DegT/DnrJ/EryC1/StrS family aminotransferase [Candidatus Microgenomates bacterium]
MIPITKPVFDKSEERLVAKVLQSGWVTQGPKVAEFENLICEYTGAKYAVATTSATTALFLSLHLLGIDPADEVIVPSFSFIATSNVAVHVGATPIFADIDPRTYNIDPTQIERLITKKTRAIIPVDQIGLPADMDKILKIAKKYKLHVVEDAACALGSVYKGRKIGSFGDLACLSFHPRKTITTGEGGMILTNNKTWAEKLRILRHQGMSISDVARHKSNKIIQESYPVIGYNFRMSDLQAAVGVAQMAKLPKILVRRASLAERYNKAFNNSDIIIPPYVPENYVTNWQSYMVRLVPNKKITRNELMQRLLDDGISTRLGIMAAHLEPAYTKTMGKIFLPVTEKATKETMILPLYFQMTKLEQDYVIKQILQHVKS